MSSFEFLMVLVGLVGAIAISEILAFWGHTIRNWRSVKKPGLFFAASGWLLVVMIGHILGIWAYHESALDPNQMGFVVVLPVIVLTLAITIMVPGSDRESITDLEAHYFSVAPAALCCVVLQQLLGLLADRVVGAQGVPAWWYAMTLVCLLVALATIRSRAFHIAGWIAMFGLIQLAPLTFS